MSFLRSILNAVKPAMPVITTTGAADLSSLPRGFIHFQNAAGEFMSLGYKWADRYAYEVGGFVVDGRERIPVPTTLEGLPVVKLNFKAATAGVQKVGGVNIMDTDALEEWDGSVGYNGDQRIRRESPDPAAALDGGLWGGGYTR